MKNSVIKKIIALALCAALCVCLCSCGRYNPQSVGSVVTADGEKIDVSCGRFLMAQLMAAGEGAAIVDEEAQMAFSDILAGNIDGVAAAEWIKNTTDKNLVRTAAVEKLFDDLGLSIDEDSQSFYDYSITSAWNNYYSLYMQNGIAHDSFSDYQMSFFKQGELAFALFDDGGRQQISDADVREFAKGNVSNVNIISVSAYKMDGSALSADEQAALSVILADVQENAKDASLGLAGAFAARETDIRKIMGVALTDDPASPAEDLLCIGDGMYPEQLQILAANANEGDVLLYTDEGSATYIVEKVSMEGVSTSALRHKMVTVKGSDLLGAYLDSCCSGWSFEADSKAREYYSVSKIKLG